MNDRDDTENSHITRLPDPAALSSGEFNRSRRTRLRILGAGVAVLARDGYKKLSTTGVAKEAGITRAAMLYHFGSRAELIEAIIRHVTRRRIDMYTAAMEGLPHDEGFLERAVDIAWEQLQTPEFEAYTELSLASRTDPALRALMEPALAAFDRARREAALGLFPRYLSDSVEFDLRRDIVRFLLEGVAQQDGITFNREERTGALLRFLKLLIGTQEGVALLRKVARGAHEDDAA
ncbi:TetR/AcrR family transcriptional regulator [Erythrobacter sp. HL-111]|uniref:TetR/AcrR family transcriptional regulator n=1 Tax=Erythrobacter sp. HL-111 TaxID=1798193 RepID=UPI0006DA8A62|nr:TetR/AcrR family transcriptional regulator [Erythrobacter sp. HL-111]KPP95005.1 MAG: TetR family transcriptional regulator [Erythrobacteraceae bacterium HL-111]SDS12262.1 transcriptional regulator, TetR family [Erythrobacter sp. HL-111]